MASNPRGCHCCSSVATSWSLLTVKVVGLASFLASTLGSPEAWNVRRWSISPSPTGVKSFETVSSWWMRARTASAPTNSCVGKTRLEPENTIGATNLLWLITFDWGWPYSSWQSLWHLVIFGSGRRSTSASGSSCTRWWRRVMSCHLSFINTSCQVPHVLENRLSNGLLALRDGNSTTGLGLPSTHQWLEDHSIKIGIIVSQQRKSGRSLDATVFQVGRQLSASTSFGDQVCQGSAAMRPHHDEVRSENRAARMLLMHHNFFGSNISENHGKMQAGKKQKWKLNGTKGNSKPSNLGLTRDCRDGVWQQTVCFARPHESDEDDESLMVDPSESEDPSVSDPSPISKHFLQWTTADRTLFTNANWGLVTADWSLRRSVWIFWTWACCRSDAAFNSKKGSWSHKDSSAWSAEGVECDVGVGMGISKPWSIENKSRPRSTCSDTSGTTAKAASWVYLCMANDVQRPSNWINCSGMPDAARSWAPATRREWPPNLCKGRPLASGRSNDWPVAAMTLRITWTMVPPTTSTTTSLICPYAHVVLQYNTYYVCNRMYITVLWLYYGWCRLKYDKYSEELTICSNEGSADQFLLWSCGSCHSALSCLAAFRLQPWLPSSACLVPTTKIFCRSAGQQRVDAALRSWPDKFVRKDTLAPNIACIV